MISTITEGLIVKSYKELVDKYGAEKVTVAQLCRNTHIRRQTFYYHFHDLRELLEFIYRKDMEEVLEKSKTCASWEEGMLSILTMIQNQKNFVLATYHTMTRDQLHTFLCEHIRELLLEVLVKSSTDTNITREQLSPIADYHKYGFAGTVMDWVRNGMEKSPKEVVSMIEVVIENGFRDANKHVEEIQM